MMCGFMLLQRSNLEWGCPYSKFSFGELYRRTYGWKQSFTALLARCRKTYIRQYTSPIENFEYSYPLIISPTGGEILNNFRPCILRDFYAKVVKCYLLIRTICLLYSYFQIDNLSFCILGNFAFSISLLLIFLFNP